MEAGTEVSLRITGTNPTYSGTVGTFSIEIFRAGTYTLYEQQTGISGFYI